MTPDWTVVLGQPRSNPDYKEGFALLDQLRFTAMIDAQGRVKVDKQDLGSGHSAQQQQAIQQIFTGMDEMLSGFFQTWSLFLISSPTPPASQPGVAVAPAPAGYRITYREDPAADVAIDTDRDGRISRLVVKSPQFTSAIDPQFTGGGDGWTLNHYSADYVAASGADKTHLVIDISYRPVGGVTMISNLRLEGTFGASPIKGAFAFSDCQVTRK